MAKSEASKPSRRRRSRLAVILSATAVAVALPTASASADQLQNLPQSASALEVRFSPAYDYDGDGCYAATAIAPDGYLNPGLKPGGKVNGGCHDKSDLDRAQTYSRAKCNNGWCAIMYSSYFEKDQAVWGSGLGGHRHDWEDVISWVNQSTNQVEYVSTTQHGEVVTYPRSQVRFDGSHPKVVYHKHGIRTHFFRLANSNDEPPENDYHNWRYPPLIGYGSWHSNELRNMLMNSDFGSASIKITDKDDRFRNTLNGGKPSGIPFNPWAF
ncbi:NPP1 family protein [Streptomyces marianii]|uniref:NPP1 family protein n=1 Tax=Streptomyces marianii TaxID=1817406 RepID=UPI0026B978D5